MKMAPLQCFSAVIFAVLMVQLIPAQGCPSIVPRSDWGARPPTSTTAMSTPVDYVIIHHTVTGTCSTRRACSSILRSIQNEHMDRRDYDDIGYTYLVSSDGSVYEGRGWNNQGAHAPNYNHKSIGISLIGNFQNAQPTSNQLRATRALIDCAVSRNKLKNNYKLLGHRQTKSTECPGNSLFNIIKTWPKWSSTP